jgi:hypothetical protein
MNKLEHLARRILYLTIGRINFEYRYHRRSAPLRRAATARSGGETVDDAQLIDRIVAAYRGFSHETFGDSIWTGFYETHHRAIHETLMTGTKDQVAALLRDPASSDLLYGFENLSKSLLDYPRLEDTDDPYQAFDSLLCFAEALGVVRAENHETYGLRRPPRAPKPDDIMDVIESHLKVKLRVPNPYPNEFGLRTRRGVLSYRAAQAIYQAWRIKELVGNTDNPSVVEIGAGLGRTAFYARAMGITRYTIVDVPISLVAQGYFLGRVLGPDNRVRLQSPAEFFSDTETYDLAVNVDSLTELDRALAERYIAALSSRAKALLSINHESNAFTVRQLTAQYRASRTPSWNRRGFVEETITF